MIRGIVEVRRARFLRIVISSMARKPAAAKTSTILYHKPCHALYVSQPGALLPSGRLAALVDGMGKGSGAGPEARLVAFFRPFLKYLVRSDLSPKTIQKQVDNL